MRPFEYKTYVPDTGTIAELMLRSGAIQSDQILRAAQIAANAQRDVGTAEANAQLQRGQIYGQSIGNITQALGAIPGNIEAQKRTALAAKELGLRTEQQQMQVDALKRQRGDEYLMDQAFSPRAQGGGLDDSGFAPPAPAMPPPMPVGGGPNDAEYAPPVVPPLTAGVTPQTLPGSLGAMIAGPGGAPSAPVAPSPQSPPPGAPQPGPPVVPTTVVPPDARPQSANPNTMISPTREEAMAQLPWRLRGKAQAAFDAADKNTAEIQTMQEALKEKHAEATGGLAISVAEHGYNQTAFNMAVDAAEARGSITPEQKADYKARGADEGQRKNITDQAISASKVGRDWLEKNKPKFGTRSQDQDIYNEGTGVVVTPGTPKPDPSSMQEVSLNGKNVVATYDPKAKTLTYQGRDIINDPTLGPKVTPRDPLAQQMSQERLDALREGAKPLDISADVQTTVSGGKYVDVSMYSAGKERDKAVAAARAAGVVPVSKEQASSLADIDTARQNQAKILAQIQDTLPKDASGRPVAAVTTTLSKLFQTNDQLAAFGTWRTAAINSMRATAGSKGLRINRAEIDAAIENDIPKLTDTLGVAQQKVKNINAMLDSVESSIITRNRSAAAPTAGAAPGTTQTIGGYKVTALP